MNRLVIVILTLFMVNMGMSGKEIIRSVQNIDFDWFFHRGDLENGESADYSQWRKLDVPHDWSIEEDYSETNRRENAFLPGGIGWYKKEINYDHSWDGKKVYIHFDGVYSHSTVYLNGVKLGYRPSGYIGFSYDLTPYLKSGKNVLSVRVDNHLEPHARWYAGSGIYRHVFLVVKNKVHVEQDGVWVIPILAEDGRAQIDVEVSLKNELDEWKTPYTVRETIVDANGNEMATAVVDGIFSYDKATAKSRLSFDSPKLWSPETPNVYYLKTIVSSHGEVVDSVVNLFGVRTLEYLPQEGFKLNGVNMKIKGVCMHQSMGAIGTAFNDDVWRQKLLQLKEMGCNAVRTSHYPFAPEFYEMCDTLGLMVLDEPWDGWFNWYGCHKSTYDSSYYFLDWWEQDLTDFIKRDRNHPCVIMWSLGNEVWGYDRHMYLQYRMNKMFHDMDPTRPTTQAYATDKYIDIAGINANGEKKGDLQKFYKSHPNMLAVGTEIPHTRQTRGVYRTIGAYDSWDGPEDKGADIVNHFPVTSFTEKELFTGINPHYASSYDNQTRQISVREQWKQTRDNHFFIGQFIWTAFDYLGESWGWPGRTNNFGIIDLAGFPKDHYYLYQSLWSDKPMVHILPHWTHPGKEGVEIPMVVYTNGTSAELFLNGRSLGKKVMDKDELQLVWNVPYTPGRISVVAYEGNKKIAEKSVVTAEEPAKLSMTLSKDCIKANRRDMVFVAVDVVDKNGNFVPYANNEIEFEVSGSYKLIGVENGDILDVSNQKQLKRKAFMGKVLLMLQATDEAGTIVVKAKSMGLLPETKTIQCL